MTTTLLLTQVVWERWGRNAALVTLRGLMLAFLALAIWAIIGVIFWAVGLPSEPY